MRSKLLIIAITSLSTFALAADGDKDQPRSPENQAAAIIKKCDTDGNGTISKKEFHKSEACKEITRKHGADDANKEFAHADNNKDGELTKSEIARMDYVNRGKPGAKKHKKGKAKAKGKGK